MTANADYSVLVAPAAFKGTMGPGSVSAAMLQGVRRALPDARVVLRPVSDGGNGLLEVCQALEGGALQTVEVGGPRGQPVQARWLRRGSAAVIETAEACGLHLLPPQERDPLLASTRGVGELVLAALRGGASEIVLGLGGSGTVDGGTGMARALGWRFADAAGTPLPEGGGSLKNLHRIEPPADAPAARVEALCDVDNPLTGPRGAARVFAPQKGAGPADVEILESGLARLAEVLESQFGRPVAESPGSGAAGGLGAGARAFLGARLVRGADWMFERAGLAEQLRAASLVITGEGRFDAQSQMGKVTGRVVEAARAAGLPVLLVCGRVDGAVPAGVTVRDAGGRILTAEDIAGLTYAGCRALAGGDRL